MPFHLTETLRPQLATLLGRAGFCSLLARGLALAGREAPWLRTLHVNPNGSLHGGGEVTAKQIAAGDVLLLAELLGLLVAFIGEGLTLQIVREAWPKLPLDDSDISQRIAQ